MACGGKHVEPISAKDDDIKRVLVISNDSTVFLSDKYVSAFEMFGGRLTEVKKLVERLNDVCEISFAIITGRYGFIPANFVIEKYDNVPSCKDEYEELQERKDFVGTARQITPIFDRVIVCVPKDMFAMLIPALPKDKVIAVTNEIYKDDCKKYGWSYYPRNGARVGNANADAIVKEITEFQKHDIPILR